MGNDQPDVPEPTKADKEKVDPNSRGTVLSTLTFLCFVPSQIFMGQKSRIRCFAAHYLFRQNLTL